MRLFFIMFAIYVIHKGDNSMLYKIGSHTGNIKCLISRYITAIPLLKIYQYHLFNNRNDMLRVEHFLKNKYLNERLSNINGNLSEWYNLDEKLLDDVKNNIENSLKLNSDSKNKIMSQKVIERKINEYKKVNINALINMFNAGNIVTPAYQRERDNKRLDVIKQHIIDNISNVNFYIPEIVLNTRGNKYRVIDGQHRLYALLNSTDEDLLILKNLSIRCVVIHELNDDEEKQLFMNINKSVPCPNLFLQPEEKINFINGFKNNIKNIFEHNISASEKPRLPNFNIRILIEAITHIRSDDTSYINDWYSDGTIKNDVDLYNAFIVFNEYLGNKLTGNQGFRVYKLNCPRSSDKHDEARFISLLEITRKRAIRGATICYIGFMDTERLLRCVFNHGMLY